MHQELIELLQSQGASLVGFADLSGLPESAAQGYCRGVSIGVALQKSVLRLIPTGPHREYEQEYNNVNALLNRLGLLTEAWLEEQGETACAITTERASYGRVDCRTTLPHKTVARLAGHGWVGKSALLCTPEYGSAIRFTTVLTNAKLPTGGEIHPPRCGSCRQCADACPGGAINGTAWEEGIDRDLLVSTAACQEIFCIRGEQSGQKNGTCGLCIAACPHTARYLRAEG